MFISDITLSKVLLLELLAFGGCFFLVFILTNQFSSSLSPSFSSSWLLFATPTYLLVYMPSMYDPYLHLSLLFKTYYFPGFLFRYLLLVFHLFLLTFSFLLFSFLYHFLFYISFIVLLLLAQAFKLRGVTERCCCYYPFLLQFSLAFPFYIIICLGCRYIYKHDLSYDHYRHLYIHIYIPL